MKTDLSEIIKGIVEILQKIVSYIIDLLKKIVYWLGNNPNYSLQLMGNLFILFS